MLRHHTPQGAACREPTANNSQPWFILPGLGADYPYKQSMIREGWDAPVELRQRYVQLYLRFDAMDEDILEDSEEHWVLMSDGLYHVPRDQDGASLHEQLCRANRALCFAIQGIDPASGFLEVLSGLM